MSSSTALNYPLLAIPAYYLFSLGPHMYAGSILSANGYKVNNANPKASLSPAEVKGKVPDAVFQKYQRAENAHSNNIEQIPLFATAILASLLAERTAGLRDIGAKRAADGDPTGLTNFVGTFFAVRALYNIAYISIDEHQKSFLRSGFWAGGFGLVAYQIWKAAQLLG